MIQTSTRSRPGFWNATRTASAEALADWLATNPTGVQSLGTLIIGDLNCYGRRTRSGRSRTRASRTSWSSYTDGIPYTFMFDGRRAPSTLPWRREYAREQVTDAAAWHINADEVPAIDYQESVGVSFNQRFRTAEIAEAHHDPSAFRSSDHDPVLVGLDSDGPRTPASGH